jgi:hypothetical protein
MPVAARKNRHFSDSAEFRIWYPLRHQDHVEHEYVGNLHTHSLYSDGHGSHQDIARAAIQAGLDFVVVTDHNVWVQGMDGYRYMEGKRVLLLTGEEIHDQSREPQKNHLLVYETRAELAPFAPDPQNLLDEVSSRGGLSFAAHPFDPAAPLFNEDDLSWEAWDVHGLTGIELWNFMSEFKSRLTSLPRAIFYALSPSFIARAPFPQVLERWDHMLATGKRMVAIGGSDAHALPASLGPLKRTLFPYQYLFRAVNTHVLLADPLAGETARDRKALFEALRSGAAFVGNDLPASTRGFRFHALGETENVGMGGELRIRLGVTLQVRTPYPARIHIIRDGREIACWKGVETAVQTVRDPGAYRVEAYIPHRGRMCGWIFSNPIFLSS